jgi:PAS domain S-box-containing protein
MGRDAAVACGLLREGGIDASVAADFAALERALAGDPGFVVVTEEALWDADLGGIAAWVRAQPAWSDLPIIVLTRRGGGPERNPQALNLSERLGNVTFLERPFHPTTFVSVARTAVKARERQYDARARMEELHEGEQRLRTALRAGRLGSWVLDVETGALDASPTCMALFGRDEGEPMSRDTLLAIVHADDRVRVREAMKQTIDSGVDYAIEHRNVWPDGSVHWAEFRARLVRDAGGMHARLVGVASDITDRKAAEETLRRINETLEERVVARTRELQTAHATVLGEIEQRERAERQLRQVQKMETIGQLTGGVAHDFNNLLMAVMGNLDLLRKRVADDERSVRLIDGALQGAQRGATLTQRLLAFAHRQDLKVEPGNLADLVRGMADLIERSVGARVELRMQLPPKLPLILLDTNQIELAVLNLVVNARDAMLEGGTLTIAVDAVETRDDAELAPGRYVRLVVTDTGHGMDAETLRKATEPFFSTKELGKGTGLGLSMIHGLAVQMHGALRLASEVGRGTRAEVWLPVTTSAAPAGNPVTVPVVKAAPRRMTVLVVDDDELIATSTAGMLEDLGHGVLEAASGTDALDILRRGEVVDFVVTDYSMPGMNGLQFAEVARRMRPDLPILLVSGYADLPRDSGIDLPRIGKPYRQAELAAEIERILGMQEGVPGQPVQARTMASAKSTP